MKTYFKLLLFLFIPVLFSSCTVRSQQDDGIEYCKSLNGEYVRNSFSTDMCYIQTASGTIMRPVLYKEDTVLHL